MAFKRSYSYQDWDKHAVYRQKSALESCLLAGFVASGICGSAPYTSWQLHALLLLAVLTLVIGLLHLAYCISEREPWPEETATKDVFTRQLGGGDEGGTVAFGSFLKDGSTGSASQDWALYSASPLHAFASDLHVKPPLLPIPAELRKGLQCCVRQTAAGRSSQNMSGYAGGFTLLWHVSPVAE